MRDRDSEAGGREQIPDVEHSHTKQARSERARRLRRGRRRAGRGGDRRRAVRSRGLSNAEPELDRGRHAGAAHAVQRDVHGAIRGDVERIEFESADWKSGGEHFSHGRRRGSRGRGRRAGGRFRRRVVTAAGTRCEHTEDGPQGCGRRSHAFHSTILEQCHVVPT